MRYLPHSCHPALPWLHTSIEDHELNARLAGYCSQDVVIGEGRHCKVWKARERKTINYYALKRVDCSTRSRKERVEQEVDSASSSQSGLTVLAGQNPVQLHGGPTRWASLRIERPEWTPKA